MTALLGAYFPFTFYICCGKRMPCVLHERNLHMWSM